MRLMLLLLTVVMVMFLLLLGGCGGRKGRVGIRVAWLKRGAHGSLVLLLLLGKRH